MHLTSKPSNIRFRSSTIREVIEHYGHLPRCEHSCARLSYPQIWSHHQLYLIQVLSWPYLRYAITASYTSDGVRALDKEANEEGIADMDEIELDSRIAML